MPRKKLDRAELAEKLRQWANDDGIKASPDFLFRTMDAARRRPVPVVSRAQSRTFEDLLSETIPPNELERTIEKAFHEAREKAFREAPAKPYSGNLLSTFFYHLTYTFAHWRRQEYAWTVPWRAQIESGYIVFVARPLERQFDIAQRSITSVEQLAEFGPTVAGWNSNDNFNAQQLQLLEDFKEWTWSGKAPSALYKHVMEALRTVPVLDRREARTERGENLTDRTTPEGVRRREQL